MTCYGYGDGKSWSTGHSFIGLRHMEVHDACFIGYGSTHKNLGIGWTMLKPSPPGVTGMVCLSWWIEAWDDGLMGWCCTLLVCNVCMLLLVFRCGFGFRTQRWKSWTWITTTAWRRSIRRRSLYCFNFKRFFGLIGDRSTHPTIQYPDVWEGLRLSKHFKTNQI